MFRNSAFSLVAPAIVALAVFAVLPAPSSAQGLTCGWCNRYEGPDGSEVHKFPFGGDECEWPPTYHGTCARCGGTSDCHDDWEPGDCHIECGEGGGEGEGSGDLAQAVEAIETGLETRDMTIVAAALLHDYRSGLQVEYLPEAGRIEFILACSPWGTARTVPVPPGDVRVALEAELGALTYVQRGATIVTSP